MNDYKTALKEYQELQYMINNQLSDMAFLSDKFERFKSGMLLMEEHIKLSLDNKSSDEFFFFNPIFDRYIQEIHKMFLSYNEQITIPLKYLIQSFNNATNNSLNSFNKIKLSLIESKQKVTKARDDYYNYIKINENKENMNKDDHELFKAKKGNFSQLYKYEINKMNEIISENNKKYDEIYKSLDGINKSSNSIIKNILNKFIKSIGNIGDIFTTFSKELKECLDNNSTNDFFKSYIPQIDEITKMRFNLETFEEYNNDIEKKGTNETKDTKEQELNNKNNDNSAKLKRLISLPGQGFDDFEIIEGPLEVMSQEKMKENINKLKEIIKKLASKNELLPSEVTQLINILKEDPLEKNETFSYIFLTKIKEFYKKRVINFQNRENFVHLANIMNNLCIKEDNSKTFNAIIEVSQMIKFENIFMYCMIQKKNKFFSTKTFWLRVIEDNLINKINNYAYILLNQKSSQDTKNPKNNKNRNKNILINIGLDKHIINYYKLNEQQKDDLDKYASENICKILSKAIPGMCSFLVPEFTSINIIKHYCDQYNLDNNTFYYFQNILEAKNINNTLGLKKKSEKSKKKKAMFNIIFIISCSLPYLPKNEIINLFALNKFLKPHIEKKIFKFYLSNKNLTIEKRIELWGIILKVKNVKKTISYETIKALMKERIENNEIIKKSQEGRNFYTIDVDLIRTPFICKHQEHIEKVKWILRCLNYAKPDIGYYQGMNFLILFFYQLLNYDEEKTFYYLFSLETETKYQDIFLDDLRMLKIFFVVLDKIINLYKPEIYYKFVDNYLSTNIFSTPWFATLFSNASKVFEQKNAPKFVLKVLEDFFLDGWSAIFNCGFTLIKYYYDKIMKLEEDKLVTFMIKDFCEQDILKNENFNIIEKHYNENAEKINELLISKLVKITRYENTHSFLKKK